MAMNIQSRLGSVVSPQGVDFSIWSSAAEKIDLCLFEGDTETDRIEMTKDQNGLFSTHVEGLKAGARYGLRAHGPYDPQAGVWFDPGKLLLDPYALQIDRPFLHDASLLSSLRGEDTRQVAPKGIVADLPEKLSPLKDGFGPERLIYELQVKSFSKLHPDVPESERGTLKALAHPSIIEHLTKLNVGAVELMPINAWIDERHLSALGLSNAWGYNPVSYFALDPRLAPGGLEDLRVAVKALHSASIAVIMDVVYNHNGESDFGGTTLSFRGLDPHGYFRHAEHAHPAQLVNDTGCGNTLNTQAPMVRQLIRESLRYFVKYAGIDGFRFDLAPVLGRRRDGFDPDAPLMRELLLDPLIGERILIAEPWDIGPGGYQVGGFPSPWLEWNDKYRDDIRRFWRGDTHSAPGFATRIAGSSDLYNDHQGSLTRSVNFIAAHDGFSLADVVAYKDKHNHANGEDNRDGHHHNLSWNHGVEGQTVREDILDARTQDIKALLSTLFLSRGYIMLTAGDEFGRTQQGNNNAYAQDNEITWLDWSKQDDILFEHTCKLAKLRQESGAFSTLEFLNPENVVWVLPDGQQKSDEDWNAPRPGPFAMMWRQEKFAIFINRTHEDAVFQLESGSTHRSPARSLTALCNIC